MHLSTNYLYCRPNRVTLMLTPRQRQIARLVARGCTDKDIAGILGLAYGTVRTHLRLTYRRNRLAGRSALVRAWMVAPGCGRTAVRSVKAGLRN